MPKRRSRRGWSSRRRGAEGQNPKEAVRRVRGGPGCGGFGRAESQCPALPAPDGRGATGVRRRKARGGINRRRRNLSANLRACRSLRRAFRVYRGGGSPDFRHAAIRSAHRGRGNKWLSDAPHCSGDALKRRSSQSAILGAFFPLIIFFFCRLPCQPWVPNEPYYQEGLVFYRICAGRRGTFFAHPAALEDLTFVTAVL